MNSSLNHPRHPFAALLALGVLVAPLPAVAQSYTFSQSVGSFSSISGVGTPVTMSSSDDGSGVINLPFSFSFFGSSVSTIYPTTNGLLCFDVVSTSYSPTSLPTPGSPDGFVAGFWDDMSVPAGSGVYTQSTGVTGQRIFTIEWYRLTPLSSSDFISYQVRLYEQSGNIEILYGPSSGSFSGAASAGIEDALGFTGYGPPCGTSAACTISDLPSGTLLRFVPSGAPPMLPDLTIVGTSPLPTTVSAGGSYNLDVTVRNAGAVPSTEAEIQLLTEAFGGPAVVGEGFVVGLGAGQSTTVSMDINVPSGVPDGSYPIVVLVDPFDDINEASEANNSFLAGSVTIGSGGMSISITTNTLPQGSVGSSYSFQIQQTGATSPTWSVRSGSLPPGVQMSSSGRLSGAATTAGNFVFEVQCAQSGFTTASRTFEVEIIAATGFRVSSTQLPQGTVGQAYNGRIEATGGQAPYAFQIVSGKPDWLTMAADGSLTGTPDGTGMHELRVSVFDSATMFTEGIAMLEVVQGGPLMLATTASEVVPGVVGLPYSVQLRAAGGMQPYTFAVASGTLPGGLSLSGDTISGTPSSAGRSAFELRVTDDAGGSVSGQFAIEVADRVSLEILVPDQIILRPNAESNFELRASGGVPPYTWGILGGALPAGLRLDGSAILGTATATRATANVTIRVSDTQGETQEKAVSIEVRRSTANNSGGAGRDASGCSAVTPVGDGGSWGALVAMVLAAAALRRRRGAFLPRASVVEEEACQSRSSCGAPRSSRR